MIFARMQIETKIDRIFQTLCIATFLKIELPKEVRPWPDWPDRFLWP